MTTEQTPTAFDNLYTGSNGKISRLGDLPLPYLRNIEAKMKRQGEDGSGLYADVCVVIDAKAAEAEAAKAADMQNRGEV